MLNIKKQLNTNHQFLIKIYIVDLFLIFIQSQVFLFKSRHLFLSHSLKHSTFCCFKPHLKEGRVEKDVPVLKFSITSFKASLSISATL